MRTLIDDTKCYQTKYTELQRLQNIISQSVLYTTADLNANITSVSKAFEKLTGYKEEELLGKNHSIFRDPDTPQEFYTEMWQTLKKNEKFEGELKNYTKDKIVFWIKITIDPMFNEEGEKIGYASYRENITNTKKLEYLSTHDMLTNIYNRNYFDKALEIKINSAQRYNHKFGLMILDIDDFKKVNDTYGHNIGDNVLISIAKILKKNIKEDDILARWGGEEFAILLPYTTIDDIYNLAEKLRNLIQNSTIIENKIITASFGVGLYFTSESKIEFFEKIDNLLYQAKNTGKNKVLQ